MEWARITYSLAASVTLLAATGCLRFDGPTGLEGYCWDWATEAYVACDAGVTDASLSDAEIVDAHQRDSDVPDAASDAEVVDIGITDVGVNQDATIVDTGLVDSGEHPDAGPGDAGPSDAGQRLLALEVEPADFGAIEVPTLAAMCPPTCDWSLSPGESLSLRAQPYSGYRFGEWLGACAGPLADCELAPATSTSATARFLPGGIHWAQGWLAGARLLDVVASDAGESYVLLSIDAALTVPALGTYADPGFLLLALDASGAPRWARHFITTPTVWARLALASSVLHVALSFEGSIQQPPSTNVIQSAGGSDFLLLALSAATGVTQRSLTGSGTRSEYVADLAVDPSGVFIAGTFSSPDLVIGSAQPIAATSAGSGFVAKATNTGFVPFARVFGDTAFSFVTSVAVAQSGHVYVGGFYTANAFSIGSFDLPAPVGTAAPFVAVVTSGSGQPQWARTFSSPGSQSARVLRLAAGQTDVYVYGAFSGALDLGGGFLLQSVAAQDVFVARIDPASSTTGAYKFGSDVRLEPGDIQVLDSGQVVVTLHFNGLLSFDRFDGLVGSATLPAVTSTDFYIAVLESSMGGRYRHSWGRRFAAAGLDLAGPVAIADRRIITSIQRSAASAVDFDGVAVTADAFLISLGR